jgi:hypothetical protein
MLDTFFHLRTRRQGRSIRTGQRIIMRPTSLHLGATLAVTIVWVASALPAAQQMPLFSFHSNAWLNLHHYVRAVARGGPPQTGLSEDEQRQWTAGVEFYKPSVPRDLLLDDGMVAIKHALRGAEGKTSLDGITIDSALKTMLERLMPIYQKHWWPGHDRGNREWIAAIRPLVARHGVAISQALSRTYGVTWPNEPIAVDLSVIAGPVGGYTTNSPVPHVMISSADPNIRGYRGLEILFHESSHGLELFQALIQPLNRAAAEQKVTLPPQLWHAVLFYTAGELTTRELKANGIDYTPYADAGFYNNMCGAGCGDRIAEHWTPHLDRKRSIPDALSALVAAIK